MGSAPPGVWSGRCSCSPQASCDYVRRLAGCVTLVQHRPDWNMPKGRNVRAPQKRQRTATAAVDGRVAAAMLRPAYRLLSTNARVPECGMGEVSLIDVSKRFTLRVEGKVQTVRALERLNFSVADGAVVALIGPSGCGKTTALRIAMGLDNASGGRVTVDGVEVRGCGHDRGMVFQHAELLPWLTAMQNVMFGLEMKGLRGSA